MGGTDWLEKVYIYAALAATDTTQQAQKLLQDAGILTSLRQLEMYRRRSGDRIRRAAQRQLPERLFGLFAYDLYERLNTLARRIERRLCKSQWEEKSELDLMDKYLKLMQLLSDMKSEPEQKDADSDDDPDDEAVIEEIFRRLEQANDREKVRQRMRQAAAATGSCFEPAQQD